MRHLINERVVMKKVYQLAEAFIILPIDTPSLIYHAYLLIKSPLSEFRQIDLGYTG